MLFCWLSSRLVLLQKEVEEFLEKRKNGELLVQRSAKMCEELLANVQLSVERPYVVFDQAIQLIACDMPSVHDSSSSSSSSSLALSIVINDEPQRINRCPQIDEDSEITCAPNSKPVVRNTFIIRRNNSSSSGSGSKDGITQQYLKYGQDFELECLANNSSNNKLRLYTAPRNPFVEYSSRSHHAFKANGEMKQSVGLARTDGDRHITTTIPSTYFQWRCYHINPEIRYETIGENIPVCRQASQQQQWPAIYFIIHNGCGALAPNGGLFLPIGFSAFTPKTQ